MFVIKPVNYSCTMVIKCMAQLDNGAAKAESTVKSQIFIRYLISYFRTFEKSAKFYTG